MKILITLGSISPCDDANTNIAKLIAKELQQMGNEVALFGTSFVNAPVKEDIDGIVYYRKLSVQSKDVYKRQVVPILLTFQKIIQKRCLLMPLKKCLKSIVRKNE